MKYPEAHELETTLAAVCVQEHLNYPDRVLLRYNLGGEQEVWTVSDIMRRALDYANQLKKLDIKAGDPVAVMLNNHPDHVSVILALGLTGAVWVPLDRRFTAANVRRVLSQVEVSVAIAETQYTETLRNGGLKTNVISRLRAKQYNSPTYVEIQQDLEAIVSATSSAPNDIRALMFTSGTTGPPKGVLVTERMFIASARFCAYASDSNQQAIFYLWEPLNHIGGAQIIPMAILSGCSIAMSKKFSVSQFWTEIAESGATRLHYLGGVLELLLSQDASALDRGHNVSLGFGAGASEKISKAFTERFAIPLREVYGMTEASSFTSINFDGSLNSIGKPLLDFDLSLTDSNGRHVATGEVGEIVVKPNRCALVTPNYYRNELATNAAFRDGYFRTGDLAFQDESGYLYFVGRQKELIRSKGENISPWELESVFKQHSAVHEVAVLGAESDTTEQDIVAFVRLSPMTANEHRLVVEEILQLLKHELAPFQQPHHILEIAQFPKTPSERIEKHKLDVSADALKSGWDLSAHNGALKKT